MVALTIGMATYDDFDGVYFTVQALRMYQDLDDTELVVIDNFGCEHTRSFVESWTNARYILAKDTVGTAAGRDLLFRIAEGDAVMCMDSHVLLAPGTIARLKHYYRDHPDTIDLLQGPILYDDLTSFSTQFDPVWRDQMWGVWGTDERAADQEAEPFEIESMGLGVFTCRKAAWPGFHPAFRGFGGEEGYIHEKFRRAGGRCLCLPWLRWLHRFGRPRGVPYPLTVEAKLRNYLIGHSELGWDVQPVLDHFSEFLSADRVASVAASALRDVAGASFALVPEPPAFTPVRNPRPLVSCICMTYNRAPDHLHLLEEAIESFRRQTYPNKELVVLNDAPGQELVCSEPGVRIINVPERYPTLGHKHNAALNFARGELIAPWDDDDINLPWRLERSVEVLGEADHLNPRRYWFLDGEGWHADQSTGVGHFAALFRKEAWRAVGQYPHISLGVDYEMDEKLRDQVHTIDPVLGHDPLPVEEWFYVYRWGVSPVHLSGNGDETKYDQIGRQPVSKGRFTLRPHWRRDYVAETRAFLADRAGT